MRRLLISIFLISVFPSSLFAMSSKSQLAEIKCCANLAGSEWKLLSYQDDKRLVKGLDNVILTVKFGGDGHLSGLAGCNRYMVSYHASAGKLEIGQAAISKMFCSEPEGLMRQENLFLQAIGHSATYLASANAKDSVQLELRDSHGDVLAIFEAITRP